MNSLVVGPWPVIRIGSLALPTYYIILSLVLTLTTWYVYKRAERKQYSGTTAMDLYLAALLSGAVGARLLHVFYEAPDYYWERPWEVLYFWQGGFVYYGGAILGLVGGMIALRFKQQSLPMWLDFFAPVASIGYALGRTACYLAGCCYGKVCDLPWALPFTSISTVTGAITTVNLHPVQLYATGLELLLFGLLLYIEKKKWLARRPGDLFALWLALHAATRILIEHFRDDDRGPTISGLSISVRISTFILIGILFYNRNQRRRSHIDQKVT